MSHLMLPAQHGALLGQLGALLREHGASAWLVGGYLRDLLLGRPGADLDLAVDGPARELARRFADRSGGAYVELDDATDSARVVWTASEHTPEALTLDLVRQRAPSIEADLVLRDFSVNALALPLDRVLTTDGALGDVLDPAGGLRDLDTRLIRACGPTALTDDPLRMLRAVRLAAQLQFSIADDLAGQISNLAQRITSVAAERVRDELLKLLAQRHAAPWIAYLDDRGLLTTIMPELEPARDCSQPSQHFLPVLGHLLETVHAAEWLADQLEGVAHGARPAALERWPALHATLAMAPDIRARMDARVLGEHPRRALWKLAALLHDVGKPATRVETPDGRITFYDHQEFGAEMAARIGQRLKLSRESVGYLRLVVQAHMRPGQLRALGPELTRRAVFKLLRDTGSAAADVLLLSLCDHLAARGPYLNPQDWSHHLAWTEALLREGQQANAGRATPRLLTGRDLIDALGMAPGPPVGRVLAAIEEAQFAGEISSRDDALALARHLATSTDAADGAAAPDPRRTGDGSEDS